MTAPPQHQKKEPLDLRGSHEVIGIFSKFFADAEEHRSGLLRRPARSGRMWISCLLSG